MWNSHHFLPKAIGLRISSIHIPSMSALQILRRDLNIDFQAIRMSIKGLASFNKKSQVTTTLSKKILKCLAKNTKI